MSVRQTTRRVEHVENLCISDDYLKTWKRVFTSVAVKNECGNILHIFEILLIMPFTNAKLERMFSRMARVKTDYRNRLKRSKLDSCLRICEGRHLWKTSIQMNLLINVIMIRTVGSRQKVAERTKNRVLNNSSTIEISVMSLSDIESEDSDSCDSNKED